MQAVPDPAWLWSVRANTQDGEPCERRLEILDLDRNVLDPGNFSIPQTLTSCLRVADLDDLMSTSPHR